MDIAEPVARVASEFYDSAVPRPTSVGREIFVDRMVAELHQTNVGRRASEAAANLAYEPVINPCPFQLQLREHFLETLLPAPAPLVEQRTRAGVETIIAAYPDWIVKRWLKYARQRQHWTPGQISAEQEREQW